MVFWRSSVRPLLRHVVVTGGVVGVAGWASFPQFEDWYWLRKDPKRVFDGDESPLTSSNDKKKLVILGTGWASISVLKNIDRDKYNVTIVSPRNYFLFTPLLPSLCAGTVGADAITIPIRDFTSYKHQPILERIQYMWRGYLPNRIEYIYASATDVDPDHKVIKCENGKEFDLEYDLLVVGTGATTNTFNTKGVNEHCCFLKETGDAVLIRQAVLENLEKASLPLTSPEERSRLLSFYVIGGGPTAVEFAAELQDFLRHDVVNPTHASYHRCAGETTVSLIQSNYDLLPGYPKKIRDFTLKHLRDIGVNVHTGARATEVTDSSLSVYDKDSKNTTNVPYGLIVWATGVSPGALVKKIMSKVPEQQHFRSLKTDSKCRVIGSDGIFAIGDCADVDVEVEYRNNISNMYDRVCSKHGDSKGVMSLNATNEFLRELSTQLQGMFSIQGAKVYNELSKAFEEAKAIHDKNPGTRFNGLTKAFVLETLTKHMNRQKVLPPTAQVAHQQGEYLARLLNDPKSDPLTGNWIFDHHAGFKFRNLGQLVYVGGHMAALSVPASKDVEVAWNGSLTNFIWHAAYFGMLESVSARLELLFDWLKSGTFGRSTSLDAICSSDDSKAHDVLQRGQGAINPAANNKTENKKGFASRWFFR